MSSTRSHAGLVWLLILALCAWAGVWAWRQPQVQNTLYGWQLADMAAPARVAVPVEGVQFDDITDTWGAARSGGREHQGVDIFAPRGTPVLSSTEGLIVSVRDQGLGGKQVWVLGPGGERHYYAHLDDWVTGIGTMTRVQVGDTLGMVGNTGNAAGTPPHLHYGIYTSGGAVNPYPRLSAGAGAATDSTAP